MLKLTQLIGFGGGGTYRANAVEYDGSTDYLSRALDLAGNADSSVGIFSLWFKIVNVTDLTAFLSNIDTAVFYYFSQRLWIDVVAADGVTHYQFRTVGTYNNSSVWYHLLASWDTNHAAGAKIAHVYMNDVADGPNVVADSHPAFTIDYTRPDWNIARRPYFSFLDFEGSMAEMCFAPGQFLDFSVAANRRIFITPEGKPANAGVLGQALQSVTGAAPLLYLPNPAATVNVNSGTGGDFVINGSPTDASTSPSD